MSSNVRRLFALVLALCLAAAAASLATAEDPATGLQAEYFDAPDLTGTPVLSRIDTKIDFNWGLGEPVPGVGDTFSVRWKGTIAPRYSERYTLSVTSDDGVRLYVDGQILVDNFKPHAVQTHAKEVNLTAGRKHDIELEYHDIVRHASVRLEWKSASQAKEVVPQERLAPPVAAAALPVVESKPTPTTTVVAPGTPATTVAVEPPPPVVGGTETETATAAPAATVRGADPAPVLPPPAPPIPGETFNVEPTKGEVLVRRPGDDQLIPLAAGASLPVGTRVDSRDGAVQLETAPAAGVVQNQEAAFGGATFRVSQPREGGKVVTLDLMHGDFESCTTAPAAQRSTTRTLRARAASASRSRARAARKSVRQLWGSGKGRFRTRGRHAAATVRGTQWSVEDRCDATVVRVLDGVVDVEDFGTGKTVTLRKGDSHVAVPAPRKR